MVRRSTSVHLEPYLVNIPIKNRVGQPVNCQWPCLAPHEYFAALAISGKLPELCGGYNVAELWQAARAEAWYDGPPVSTDPDRLPYSLPIRLHGDEAQGHNKKNVGCLMCLPACVRVFAPPPAPAVGNSGTPARCMCLPRTVVQPTVLPR